MHLHSFPWELTNDLGTTENSCLVKSSATSYSGLVLEITTNFFINPLSSCSFTIRSTTFTFICLLVLLNVINFCLGRVSQTESFGSGSVFLSAIKLFLVHLLQTVIYPYCKKRSYCLVAAEVRRNEIPCFLIILPGAKHGRQTYTGVIRPHNFCLVARTKSIIVPIMSNMLDKY